MQAQTAGGDVEHLLVIDGTEHADRLAAIAASVPADRVRRTILTLPYPTGRDRYNGHRIYGAMPFLLNNEFVSFLDEDNWLDDDHIATLLEAVVNARAPWGFSLRKIVDGEGHFLMNDECECLGNLHFAMGVQGVFALDTNCYLLRREVAVEHASVWHRRFREPGKPSPDIELCNRLIRSGLAPASNRKHSVNYTVGNTEQSVRADYFAKGNATMHARYPGGLPWQRPDFTPHTLAANRPAQAPASGQPNVSYTVIR